MAVWEQKMLAPYLEVYKNVNWEEYTIEKMSERFLIDRVLPIIN